MIAFLGYALFAFVVFIGIFHYTHAWLNRPRHRLAISKSRRKVIFIVHGFHSNPYQMRILFNAIDTNTDFNDSDIVALAYTHSICDFYQPLSQQVQRLTDTITRYAHGRHYTTCSIIAVNLGGLLTMLSMDWLTQRFDAVTLVTLASPLYGMKGYWRWYERLLGTLLRHTLYQQLNHDTPFVEPSLDTLLTRVMCALCLTRSDSRQRHFTVIPLGADLDPRVRPLSAVPMTSGNHKFYSSVPGRDDGALFELATHALHQNKSCITVAMDRIKQYESMWSDLRCC